MKKNLEINITVDFRLVRLALVLLPFLCLAQDLGSESIVLSTTYPSPVGVYARIITTGGAAGNGMNTILTQNAARNGSRVGIGTSNPQALLDVNGTIRVGQALGPSCTAPGSIRFNPASTGSMQFCDNTGTWQVIGHIQTSVQTLSSPGGQILTYTCPNGQNIMSCVSILTPSGSDSCNTRISGSTCVYGNCNPSSGQYWYTTVVCAGTQ